MPAPARILDRQRQACTDEGPPGLGVRRNRIDRLMALVLDTFSHHRSVVGSDLPFSITGTAAPPFGNSLRLYANAALRIARLCVHRRLRD